MKIIITEKPSVAADIARVLGISTKKQGYFENKDTQVTWAFGHLVRLIDPDDYDESYQKWRLEDLPIMPDLFKTALVKDSRSQAQFKVIESLLKSTSAKEVICATDAGREGELIFRFIYETAQCQLPIRRLWISSQTDTAIKEGFAALAEGKAYQGLYDSARCRVEADWLVGMNATRAYTVKASFGKGVMSVGRVQTPVLKMIVDRYEEHTSFKPKTFYDVGLTVNHPNGVFPAKWFSEKIERIFEKPVAEAILEDLEKSPSGKIMKVTQKKRTEQPPLLYDLTALQKDANTQFKYSADETLKLMQSLYERHKLLTYPRTSSRYLSQDMVPKLTSRLQNLTELGPYTSIVEDLVQKPLAVTKRLVDDKKVTDHHAIIPTDKKPSYAGLSQNEKQIYDLVVKRFIAGFMPPCQKQVTEILSEFSGHSFRSSGVVIQEKGWRQAYEMGQKEPSNDSDVRLPLVKKGDSVAHQDAAIQEGQTKAPPLHTEASILGAMETAGKQIDDESLREAMKDCGLGTPATRAQILERLIQVGYVTRDKNRFSPTQKGQYLIGVIQHEDLLSPELTGQWEKKLNDMAANQGSRTQYMADIRQFTQGVIDALQSVNLAPSGRELPVVGACPKCEKNVVETKLSYCCIQEKDKQCTFILWKTMAQKEISATQVKKLLKTGQTDRLKGFKNRAGKKFDARLKFNGEKVIFEFSEALGNCPKCEGDVVETLKAYGCNQWKTTGCDFVIWKTIAGREISLKEAIDLLTKGKTEKLTGFKSRAGKTFDTTLVLQDGKINFQFD